MPRIGFYGASGEVTGSNFLVEGRKGRYVVDCGLFQGQDTIAENNQDPFSYNAEEVAALILTHAHLDHIGRVPKLVREGFRGPIYCTEATSELTEIVLKDALDLMERRLDRTDAPALYEVADLNRALAQMRPINYRQSGSLKGGDKFTLYDAGHILGSASVSLQVDGKDLVFSGDLGHWPSVLLPAPDPPPVADVVVMEATYGGRERDDSTDRLKVLKSALDLTMEQGGTLLIPAFSIERTQELLFLLHELFVHHSQPPLPIILDSPLAIEALKIFRKHGELFANNVRTHKRRGEDMFAFKNLAVTATVDESKSTNDIPNPKVIIAGSGMMVGGRISHHLKHYLPDPKTLLLVIGYQAPGTLGSQIVGGAKKVRIMGAEIPIRAKVQLTQAFSGHADHSELLEWLGRINLRQGGRVFVTHANKENAHKFLKSLTETLPGEMAQIAKHNQSVEI